MIKAFRNIRRNLLVNNKIGKYLQYALGEIVLVVLGIFIALQLNNWNEARKNEIQYKAILDQVYTVIDQDADRMANIYYNLNKQVAIIDTLRAFPERIDSQLLPHLMYYVDMNPEDITSEVSYQLGFLNFDPENILQSNLNKSLASYGNTINEKFNRTSRYVIPLLESAQLPFPSVNFGYSVLNNYKNLERDFYSNVEVERAYELLKDPLFQNALKSLRSRKALNLVFLSNKINLAKINQRAINAYYPQVKLLHSTISIVGDGTAKDDWDEDIYLTLTNEYKAIWEGDVELKDGHLKFREGGDWNFNWGADTFPKGKVLSYGNDLKVKTGKYHVMLNLSDKTFEFSKLEF